MVYIMIGKFAGITYITIGKFVGITYITDISCTGETIYEQIRLNFFKCIVYVLVNTHMEYSLLQALRLDKNKEILQNMKVPCKTL